MTMKEYLDQGPLLEQRIQYHTRRLEELRAAAKDRAWEIYDGYVERGLEMTPAFKGFAMAYVRFASREPSLFRLLFMRKAEPMNLLEFLNRLFHFVGIIRHTRLDQLPEPIPCSLQVYAHGVKPRR